MAPEEDDGGREAVLPLVEEALRLGKRRVETGRVRVSVSTEAEERLVQETLRSENVSVERLQLDRELAAGEEAPAIRHEEDGAVLVLPILEEILVIEKRLVLREEIRLRTTVSEEPVEQVVTLRRQRAEVERLPPEGVPEGLAEGEASPVRP